MEFLNLYSDGRCELFLRWSQLWACVRLYSDCDLQDRTDHHSSGCSWQWINAACCKSLAYLPTFCSKHGILWKSHVYSEGHNLLQSLNAALATYTFSTFAVVCCFQIHWTRSLLESLRNLDTHKSKFQSRTNRLAAGSMTGTVSMCNCTAGTLSKVDLLKSMSIIALSKRHACLQGNALWKMGIEKLWEHSCKETLIYSTIVEGYRSDEQRAEKRSSSRWIPEERDIVAKCHLCLHVIPKLLHSTVGTLIKVFTTAPVVVRGGLLCWPTHMDFGVFS